MYFLDNKKDKKMADDMSKKSTLLFEAKEGEPVEADERFFPDEDIEENEPKAKVFDEKFKKQIKVEEKKAKKAMFQKSLKIKSGKLAENFTRVLDFCLNIFSLLTIIIGVLYSIHYIIEANPFMVVVCCLFVFIAIYLNEKIN